VTTTEGVVADLTAIGARGSIAAAIDSITLIVDSQQCCAERRRQSPSRLQTRGASLQARSKWLSPVCPGFHWLPPTSFHGWRGFYYVITLLLTPAADLALGDYTGNIVVRSTNSALSVRISFRAVSAAKGNLLLTPKMNTLTRRGFSACDQRDVVISDALTGTPVVTNYTGSDGMVLFSNLVEAYYVVDVRAMAIHRSAKAHWSRQTKRQTWSRSWRGRRCTTALR